MNEYVYFPVLKTRPSEIKAFSLLDEKIKDAILPIIELTGAIGYTLPKTCKDESKRGIRVKGNINSKIEKILSFMEDRRFILDITDDDSLKYDGLSSSNGGLLDPADGYKSWISFLTQDSKFKELVIPTIQFDSTQRVNVEKQIISLSKDFDTLSIKLPFDAGMETIEMIVSWIVRIIGSSKKLILIIDFGYAKSLDLTLERIKNNFKKSSTLSNIKAVIPVSSSFPRFVNDVERPIKISENSVYETLSSILS